MIALHTEIVSEVTLPLFTSQRLLASDCIRWAQDRSSTANLIGFNYPKDKNHIEAVKAANSRPVRNTQLRDKIPSFIFAGEPIRDQARRAIINFENDLPYQYEEHRDISEIQENLRAEALKYAELADPETYKAYRTAEDSDQIVIVHHSPSAANPENVVIVEEATKRLTESNLWAWASKSFEEGLLCANYTIDDAIALAKDSDSSELFDQLEEGDDMEAAIRSGVNMRRGGVAATAAIVLNFREGRTPIELEWAREVLERAMRLPEKRDGFWSPQAIIPWHQAVYVARGLGADLREGTAAPGTVRDLLGLIAHPLETVSLSAIEEACKLWGKDSKLTWAALIVAFSLCHVPPRSRAQDSILGEMLHTSDEAKASVAMAIEFYQGEEEWMQLPLPPAAWVKVKPKRSLRQGKNHDEFDTDEEWGEPDGFWHSKKASEILKRIPHEVVLDSSAKLYLLDFLEGVLHWTNLKHAPPWAKSRRRDSSADRMFEWTHVLGTKLGQVAGLLPVHEFQPRFLDPILGLEGENCWALLARFVDSYVCAFVYDAPAIPSGAFVTLEVCLDRFLRDPVFERNRYRSGEFSGFHQPDLVRTLMFVSVERADLAARYVNGDWSEIGHILPLVDRFIRAGGWGSFVMGSFLTLCERAKDHYSLCSTLDGAKELKKELAFLSAISAVLRKYHKERRNPSAVSMKCQCRVVNRFPLAAHGLRRTDSAAP